jgi:hypothetical protein
MQRKHQRPFYDQTDTGGVSSDRLRLSVITKPLPTEHSRYSYKSPLRYIISAF